MRINKHTDYSLRVLLYLASHPGERVATQHIADAHQISAAHLQKVVRRLGELELVELHRGQGGGVELAVDPAELSIGAAVRSLDDATALVECFLAETDNCAISSACRLKGALGKAQEAFYAALDDLTLADLVSGRAGARLRALTG